MGGGRSHVLGGGKEGKGGVTGNTAAAMAAAEAQLRIEGVPEANIHAAAALMVGQAMAESGLDPNAWHDNHTGYGIYGASGGRRGSKRLSDMLAWEKEHGFAANLLEGQMREMVHSGMTDPAYAKTRAALMQATEATLDRDTRTITPNFEGPAIDNSGARVGFARSAAHTKVTVRKTPGGNVVDTVNALRAQ